MKSVLFLFCTFFLCTSCQWFQTEKVTSDTFLEEELKTINWNDIESEPLLEACDESGDKTVHKPCFEETLRPHISTQLSNTTLQSDQTLNETIHLHPTIDNSA